MVLATSFYYLLDENLRLWWFSGSLVSRRLSSTSNLRQDTSLDHKWWYGTLLGFWLDNLKSFAQGWLGGTTSSLIYFFIVNNIISCSNHNNHDPTQAYTPYQEISKNETILHLEYENQFVIFEDKCAMIVTTIDISLPFLL